MAASIKLRTMIISTALALALISAVAARPAQADTATFTQTGDITFPDLGYGSPVPSNLLVGNLKGTTTKVTMHLEDFTSSNPRDIDLLLVSPDNRTLTPISDAGGTTDIVALEFDFDDAATALPSLPGPLAAGTYKPSDYTEVNEVMGMGAPDPPYGTSFAGFNGVSANGTWKLYGFSDFFDGGGSSSISEWRLTVTTAVPELTITAKKQKLKGKVKFTATSTSAGTLVASGGIKTKTVQLTANVAAVIKARLKRNVRNRLLDQLDNTGKAKVTIKGTVTDVTGATDFAKAKAKLKS